MAKTYFSEQPDKIMYMSRPDGLADVWLREDITETTDDEGGAVWTADEVYIQTAMSESEVEEDFDILFENGSATVYEATTEEQLEALSSAVTELAELIAELMEG